MVMHILLLPSWYPETPTDLNGIFFRQQAQALQKGGFKVGVLAPQFRSLRGQPTSLFSHNYGQRIYTEAHIPTYTHRSMDFFPRVPFIDRVRWLRAGMALWQRYVAEQGKPDVLHAHCVNYGGILAHHIHRQTGIPYVITEHSSTYARGLIRAWQRSAMQQAVADAAACLAVSRDFCDVLQRFYPQSQWAYLPNMLSPLFAEPFEMPSKTAQSPFVWCSVAHLNANKGFDVLLRAFAQARHTYPAMQLHIGGNGALLPTLQQLASELQLGDTVRFLGALSPDKVREVMRQSDAFVLASKVETFGIVWIEALSQGLPIVATRCGGAESIVTADNGYLVPVDDVDALAQAMCALYQQHTRYSPMQLRQDCLARFGESALIDALRQYYQHAISC